MRTHTKIICTIGPPVDSLEKIIELISAGMDVARLNFSHGTHDTHKETIAKLKKAREITKQPLAIMLDTKGPEIRVHKVKNKSISVDTKQKISLIKDDPTNDDEIQMHPFSVSETIEKGNKILFNDGFVSSKVIEKSENKVIVEIENKGSISEGNSINIPHVSLNLPALTEDDIEDLKFGCSNDIDIVAASFIRSPEHVLSIKQLLSQEGKPDIPVIAKIENSEGIDKFDYILDVADGIMVARGDLGVEVDLSVIPKLQKSILKKCHEKYKPVIIATQMLESMINNPRPTRAEVSDVANAIYESATCVMLSGETAKGKYPIETVRIMKNVIKKTEEDFDYQEFMAKHKGNKVNDTSSSVALAAVKCSYNTEAKAIFIYSSSGFTARLLSRWRPDKAIIVLTTNMNTYHQLSFLWGVIPVHTLKCKDENEAFSIMSKFALENKLVSFGDLIVMTAGTPFGRKGSTNLLIVDSIGHVLVRGKGGFGEKAEGRIAILHSPEGADAELLKNRIVVMVKCDESYYPILKNVSGIILQNDYSDLKAEEKAEKFAKDNNIPIITGADNANTLLKEGERVIIDPSNCYIYPEKPSK